MSLHLFKLHVFASSPCVNAHVDYHFLNAYNYDIHVGTIYTYLLPCMAKHLTDISQLAELASLGTENTGSNFYTH